MGTRPRWDRYEPLLLDAMGVTPLAVDAARGERAWRGLFMPSFHRDVCVTAVARGDAVSVDVVALDGLARAAVMRAIGVRSATPDATPPPSPPWRRARVVEAGRVAGALAALASVDRVALLAPRALGLDGIALRGEIADAGGTLSFAAWSPTAAREGAPHAFFAALHGIATASADDEAARVLFEQLHGYLDLGLPARDLGGSPRCVRLFGRLSAPASPALVAWVEALVTDEALVLDLGNFEGMGTALHPLFRALAARPGRTAWCASEPARIHLDALRVPRAAVFDDVAAARAALAAPQPG